MSDKTNGGDKELFSIDDIIAEVKAERSAFDPDEVGPDLLPLNHRNTTEQPASHASDGAEEEPSQDNVSQFRFVRQGSPEHEAESGEADGSEEPDDPDITYGISEGLSDKGPGRRVILFKRRKKEEPPQDEEEETEDGEESELEPYPVSDDEYYLEEEEYEEEAEGDELPYDFLNVMFDDPTRAVKKLGKKLVGMSVRMVAMAIVMVVGFYLTFAPAAGMPSLPAMAGLTAGEVASAALTVLTAVSLGLCWEVTTAGLWRLIKLRPTMDSLTAFSALAAILHGIMVVLGVSEGVCLGASAQLCCFTALLGKRSRAITLRRTYKCIEIASDPMAVKAVGGKKYRAAIKTHNRSYAETEEVAGRDMAEKTSCVFAPIAIAASVALAAVASIGKGDGLRFFQALAAITSVISPCALHMASSGPWAKIGKRLFTSGAAILDHRSAARLASVKHASLSDNDIFPLGSVYIAGMKITSATIKMEQVVADAAAVMKEVGGGVGKAFGDFAREQYLVPRRALNVRYYEGGGIAATVQGDYVLIGSVAFLQKMGVMIHEGSDKKDAVFVAVNSYQAAIFTLKYTVQPQPYTAFGIFGRFGVTADMAVKDFGVTEKLVADRFSVKPSLLNIPDHSVKEAYWDEKLGVEEPVSALLTRDSVLAMAEVIGGAKCLTKTVRLNLFCAYACSIIGMMTLYFLAAVDKLALASPGNIILYLLVWLLPVRFASSFMTKY